ncbi:MAG: hypothetical protein LAO05_13070 [Acidobacteriia bacterium]|nr:hypothetical protein [Terriglobia bacterium]
MILVRDVFQLKFGKAKEAKALLKERARIWKKVGLSVPRPLMDLTGPHYTLVLESTYENLAEWEAAMGGVHGAHEWVGWFERFQPLVESGHREIFTVIER